MRDGRERYKTREERSVKEARKGSPRSEMLRKRISFRERDKREEGAERNRSWHLQTKCYDPAAPKLSLKDQKAGITAGRKQGVVTGREVIFFPVFAEDESKKEKKRPQWTGCETYQL